ncbi:transglycosylase SLT domain-containing protein [Candidatus Peregrinibacteria bacterium]|nr:transglycosylase SLT domain-containing protein [Candidatus Peregrinibacteria bacterium]
MAVSKEYNIQKLKPDLPNKPESKEFHESLRKHQIDLDEFIKRIENKDKKEIVRFQGKLEKWDLKGDTEKIRRAGISEKQNEKDALKRHELLSASFLQRLPGNSLTYKIDFKGNMLAEWKVGLGDMLPTNIKEVHVVRGPQIYVGVRAQNPQTGRIGYYEKNAIENGRYDYLAVHTGDTVQVKKTASMKSAVEKRHAFREHLAIYNQNAMGDDSSEGSERRYNARERKLYPSEALAVKENTKSKKSRTRKNARSARRKFRREVLGNPSRNIGAIKEINGQQFERIDRNFWMKEIAATQAESKEWIITKDPLTGGPVTFMGAAIPGGISLMVYPYLKEVEARYERTNSSYKVKSTTAYAWRPIRGGKSMSYHSWAAAIDINPADHPLGKRNTGMDPELIRAMESCGFEWGGRWKTRADDMHFELRVNPASSESLLKTAKGRQYMAALKQQTPQIIARINDIRQTENRPLLSSNIFERNQQMMASRAEKTSRGKETKRYSIPNLNAESVDWHLHKRAPMRKNAESMRASIENATGKWLPLIESSCRKHGITDYIPLVRAIMYQESKGNPRAVGKNTNGTRDQGLMQLNSRYFKHPNVMDPAVNIDLGVKHLAGLLKRYNGNVIDVAAAYNCGHAEAEKIGKKVYDIPHLTRETYVPNVLTAMSLMGKQNLPQKGNFEYA